MTDERAEQVANVLLAAAAVGVAVYVIRTPPLRRLAWRFAVTALTGDSTRVDRPGGAARLDRERPRRDMIVE